MRPKSQNNDLELRVKAFAESALGAPATRIEAIAPGLGSRRFYRVCFADQTPETAIVRVELPEDPTLRPQGVPPEPPLEPLRHFLESQGLPVPKRYAADVSQGFELLEDAGPVSLEVATREVNASERCALYAEACSWIPKLQALEGSAEEIAAFGRRLDSTLIAYKAEQLIEWGFPWAMDRQTTASEMAVIREAFSEIATECEAAPARLSHRDYKAANLHVLPRSRPSGRLLMIDIQGAFMAPPEYDLVCLLRDAQIALDEEEVNHHLEVTRPKLPDAPDPATFTRRLTLLTVSGSGKILGRFVYAAQVRGDARYLQWLPGLVNQLKSAAATASTYSPALARLAELLCEFPELEARSLTGRPISGSDSRTNRDRGKPTCAP